MSFVSMVLVFVIGSILPEDQKQSAQFIYCKLKQNNELHFKVVTILILTENNEINIVQIVVCEKPEHQ